MEMVYPSKLRISISQTCFFGHEAIKILNHTPICHIRNVECWIFGVFKSPSVASVSHSVDGFPKRIVESYKLGKGEVFIQDRANTGKDATSPSTVFTFQLFLFNAREK